ncbi:MAG TPA: acyltransferase [Blastocatellia bacterium]|nr:acyltransferase [Blastocatellia bacterium]
MNQSELIRSSALRSFSAWLSERLSRVTSSGDLIPEIDGLRFIAIGTVILHHTMAIYLPRSGRSGFVRSPQEWFAAAEQSWIVLAAYCGHFGVHLFFVISGFILALPFARKYLAGLPPPSLRSYYLRRVTRIEPPYILCLVLFFLYLWNKTGEAVSLVPSLIASLFYSHGLVYGQGSRINEVTWSLEIEIQFYLLVPLLVRLFMLRSALARRALLSVLMLGFGLLSQQVFGNSPNPLWRHTLPNYLHYFLAGFLLADLYLTSSARSLKKYLSWDLATLIAAAAIAAVLLHFYQYLFALPFLVALLYAGFFLGRFSNALIRTKWIVITGGMCYTFYLYHTIVIGGVMDQTIRLSSAASPFILDFLVQFLLVCVPVFAVCSWLFVYTEKPFMKWSLSARPAPAVQHSTGD